MNMVRTIFRSAVLLAFMLQCSLSIAQITWRRAYGALADDRGVAVRAVSEDLIMAVGSTGSFGDGSSDTYLMATDGAGVRLWSRTIGGANVDRPTEMRICDNGDLIIAGVTSGEGGYDGSLVRTDADGEVLWSRTYGGSDWDFIYDVKELPDGGLLLAGQTYSFGEPGGNAWLLRTNSVGDTLWTRTFGGSGEHEALSAIATQDGGYALAGSLNTPDRDRDVLVVKLDALGNTEWIQTHGGDSLDVARDIIAPAGGGYSIVGATRSASVWNEGYHLKLFPDGSFQWEFIWGQINDQEFHEHIVVTNDDYLIAGYTKTSGGGGKDMILQRVTVNGGFIYGHTFGGPEDDDGVALDRIADGFVAIGSTETYGAGGWDIFMVRTGPNGLTASQTVLTSFDPLSVEELGPSAKPLVLFPNPSTGWIEIGFDAVLDEVRLLDALGRVVEEHRLNSGVSRITSRLPSGAYIVEATAQNGELRRGRILIERP
ncbi:MAG: T9SS type A sorting domain-containing protein [Flavobacteriales bacterium]